MLLGNCRDVEVHPKSILYKDKRPSLLEGFHEELPFTVTWCGDLCKKHAKILIREPRVKSKYKKVQKILIKLFGFKLVRKRISNIKDFKIYASEYPRFKGFNGDITIDMGCRDKNGE